MYKIAKGTQDLTGESYRSIQDLISRVETEFQSAGGVPLETPVFERTDVLLGKYGEDAETKLIYRLADEGGEALALRYDLTVPFTRYVKENGIKQMRRYSIGNVYRRDQPNPKAGRFREFIQADMDIYGEKQEGMLAEATLLNAVCRVLKSLGLSFAILINDVRNLKYMLCEKLGLGGGDRPCKCRFAGLAEPPEIASEDCVSACNSGGDFRKYTAAIDKLDKQTFASLQPELTALGLTTDQQTTLADLLNSNTPFLEETKAEFASLCALAEVMGFRDNLVFTNSLARGLDYYTGFIWEFKLEGVASTISAGGRYDGLLNAPAVGISVGISRLATYIPKPVPEFRDLYYVTTVGTVGILDKMRVVKQLQDKGYSVSYSLSLQDKKLGKVITDCCASYIRFVAIVGESELASGQFSIKDLKEKTQTVESICRL